MGGRGSSPFFPFISGKANNHPQTKVWIPAPNQLQQTGGVLVFLFLRFFPSFFPNFTLCCWFGIHIHLNPHRMVLSLTLHWVNKHLFYLFCPHYLRIPFDAPLCWESQGTIISSFSPCHSRFWEMSSFSSSVLCFFSFFPLFFSCPQAKNLVYIIVWHSCSHTVFLFMASPRKTAAANSLCGVKWESSTTTKKVNKNILLW